MMPITVGVNTYANFFKPATTLNVPITGSTIIPKGWYYVITAGEIQANTTPTGTATWVGIAPSASGMLIFSDGINFQVYNSSAAIITMTLIGLK